MNTDNNYRIGPGPVRFVVVNLHIIQVRKFEHNYAKVRKDIPPHIRAQFDVFKGNFDDVKQIIRGYLRKNDNLSLDWLYSTLPGQQR